ncbi:MAG: T9SS type A sorting domain-containing protein [Bacteroidia bacterium]
MKKSLVLLALFLGCFQFSKAQNCMPNDTIPDSLLGVFPMPYDVNESPEGGIKDTACVGFDFEFVFTAIVGDSFTLGEITLPLDSMWLDQSSAVKGLPSGLDYACDPPTCVFKRESKGCVVIYGKPSSGTEGIHKMSITGKLYADGKSFGLPLTFPDPTIAPGEYAIVVADKTQSPCAKLSVPNIYKNIIVYPNPTSSYIAIKGLKNNSTYSANIFNILGNRVMQSEINSDLNQINVNDLAKGVYYLVINGEDEFVKKIIIE